MQFPSTDEDEPSVKEVNFGLALIVLLVLLALWILLAPMIGVERGRATIFSLAVWLAFHGIGGMATGSVTVKSHVIRRADRPAGFWFGVITYLVMSVITGYAGLFK